MKRLLIGLVFMGLPVAAFAQMPPPPPRAITVSGDSSADIAPDRAVLSMSLVSKNKSLGTAKQQNDALVKRLVAVTADLSIPKDKVATSGIYISPEYDYTNNGRHFTGYTVSRSLRVTMDSTDVPEKLLSAAIDAGVDQVSGIDFTLADPEAHATALRVKAFENAKAKAEVLAKAAGAKLGPVLNMSLAGEQPFMPRPMAFMAAASAAKMSEAPSLPGMVELRQSVTVTFALE